jgi:hypothetical protein
VAVLPDATSPRSRCMGYLPILNVVLEYRGRWKPMNYDE